MTTAYRSMARVVALAVAARLVLVLAAHYWNIGQVAAGHDLTRQGVTDNAGDGLDWLLGQVVVPLLAIGLVIIAALTQDRRALGWSAIVLALAVTVIGLGMLALSVPVLAALAGIGEVALAVVAWLAPDAVVWPAVSAPAGHQAPSAPAGTPPERRFGRWARFDQTGPE